MKKIPLLLLCVLIAVVSCKKKDSPLPAPGTYPLNSLTGMRCPMNFDSGSSLPKRKYVTWKFTGSNPIIATPVSDEYNFGTIAMYFTGQNATSLIYSHDTSNYRNGTILTVKYNTANMPDTIFMNARWSMYAFINRRAYVFQYSGGKVSEVTYVYSSGVAYGDTLKWASPGCRYHFTYDGPNVAQVLAEYLSTPGSTYSIATNYRTGKLKNNLAKAMPQWLLFEFMKTMKGMSDFPEHLPFYLSENVIVSVTGGNHPNEFSYLTDDKNRITHSISPGNYVFDTTTYYY